MASSLRLLPLVLFVVGCTSEPSFVFPDASGADSGESGPAVCGGSLIGTSCTRRGEAVALCSCMDDAGFVLICCSEYGIVRSKGCQTKDHPASCGPSGWEDGPVELPSVNGTTGKECTDDATCDPRELGTSFCSPTGFTSGSLYPTPVCFSVDCDAGDGTKVKACDGDTGVCFGTSSGGICLPACEFDDTGAPPKGCVGKNKCNAHGWGLLDAAVPITGVGYCFGGCREDGDCPTGNVCQVETGLCEKTRVTYTKSPGDPCVKADVGLSPKCNCLYTTTEGTGYCANVCYFGETTCGAGFTCDPELPNEKLRDTDTIFTRAPTGLAGYCLKNCATDADCAGLNAYCDDSAGVTQKTCHLGKRPCVTNDHCPTGQTCSGATTTALGRCG